jgi:hypothetical protein
MVGQIREHLIDLCSQWKYQQRELWKKVRKAAGWKTQCRLPKPEPNAEYQCHALLLAMGAGEANGGRKPPA